MVQLPHGPAAHLIPRFATRRVARAVAQVAFTARADFEHRDGVWTGYVFP
ncbi:hypothetical protein [Amycolatopsis sp. cmx-4-61]